MSVVAVAEFCWAEELKVNKGGKEWKEISEHGVAIMGDSTALMAITTPGPSAPFFLWILHSSTRQF